MSKTITRKYIQRITKREGDTSIRRNGGGGGGGGGVSQYWVDDNYVSKEFFNRLFEIHDENGDPILPNDVDTEIDNIQAMFGFWTNAYLSALGQNEGGGGAELTLASLADVDVHGVANGQALVYDAYTQKWVPGQAGLDPTSLWQELGSLGTEQISSTHLTTALSTYNPTNNFKTINGYSIIGTGDINVGGGGGSYLPLSGGTISGGNNFRPLVVGGTYSAITEIGIMNGNTVYSGFGYNGGYTFMGREDGGNYPKIALRHSDGAMVYSPNNFSSIRAFFSSSGENVLTINNSGDISSIMFNRNNANGLRVGAYTEHAFFYNPISGCEIELINTGGDNSIAFWNGSSRHAILHGGNFQNYALPLTGGTISGGNNFSPLIVGGTYSAITEIGIMNGNTVYSGFGYNNGYTFMGREDGGNYPKIALRHSDGAMVYSPNNFSSIVMYVTSAGIIYASKGVYSGGYVTALSDARHKDVKGDVGLTVGEVANAPAVKFLWKDRRQEGLQVGSIAQYWQKVMPEAIVKNADGELTMSYGVIALLSAISIARKVEDHERRIKELEKENKKLRKQLKVA